VNNRDQIRKAFIMARVMKWVFPFTPIVIIFISFSIALSMQSSICFVIGSFIGILASVAVYFVGIQFCRCPKCGQHWWSPLSLGFGWWTLMDSINAGGDETDTFKCRKCGLEIGPHLKQPQPVK